MPLAVGDYLERISDGVLFVVSSRRMDVYLTTPTAPSHPDGYSYTLYPKEGPHTTTDDKALPVMFRKVDPPAQKW